MHLITGGSGVLGRALIKELVGQGHNVRVLDLKQPAENTPNTEFIKGSVTDQNAIDQAVQGTEVVYHLAASMPQADLSARGFWEMNVGSTIKIAKAAVKHGLRRMVFASTIEIYGLHERHEFPVTEESQKRFTGIYSRNKLECEDRLRKISGEHGLEVVFPRMPMIFGPGFYHEPSMMLLFKLISKNRPLPVVAAPDAPWASVSSKDAATGLRLCGEAPGVSGQAFNIASYDAASCIDTLKQLTKSVGSSSRLISVPVPFIEMAFNLIEKYEKYSPTPAELVRFALVGGIYSIDKAKSVLGYEPELSCVEGMESAYRFLHGK
jgi:nucleoside-diphosphate-sugar epimerase